MSELQNGTPQRTPANRRAARIVTATIVAGGLALAGGTAYANAQTAEPAPVGAPVGAPAETRVEARVAAPISLSAQAPVADLQSDPEQDARTAFFDAGYTYDDAVALGAQWNLDSWEAKSAAGEKLLAGETLPVAPGSSAPAPEVAPAPVDQAEVGADAAALDAYFGAGYDYDDAVALGALWNVDFFEAKVSAGEKLLAGETLPVAP